MITTSDVSSSEAKEKTRIVWFCQSDSNSWDADERKRWTRYSDFESEYIEKAYQQMDAHVQFNGYIIDLKCNLQLNMKDRDEQRSVKRQEVSLSNYVREERFSYSERAISRFESEANEKNSFFSKWMSKNRHIKRNFAAVATLAAQGKSFKCFLISLYCTSVICL